MERYEVEITPQARKELKRLGEVEWRRIMAAIDGLADNPRPPSCLKMTGSDKWRIRIGDYHVIYTIADPVRRVLVVHVAHRREVYR